MSGGRSLTRIVVSFSIFVMVVSIVGFVATLMLNAFVFDDYDAYGEVPIPGEATLHLPAGEVKISFHTQTIGSIRGGGLPIPDMDLSFVPPSGVSQPIVTENIGSTTSVNNDVHQQVWVAQIPADGNYDIKTDGKVGPFINPTLAFGHNNSKGWLVWVFVGLFVVSLTALIVTPFLSGRGRRNRPSPPVAMGFGDQAFNVGYPAPPAFDAGQVSPPATTAPNSPSDDGVRIEQLKTLAALHQSGALTDQEFEAEKRRVLGG
jgi:hypothetical protein